MKNFVSILLAQRFVSTTGGRTGSLRETKLTRICWTTRISRDIDKTMVVYRLGSCICETVALAEGAAAPPKFVTGQYGSPPYVLERRCYKQDTKPQDHVVKYRNNAGLIWDRRGSVI